MLDICYEEIEELKEDIKNNSFIGVKYLDTWDYEDEYSHNHIEENRDKFIELANEYFTVNNMKYITVDKESDDMRWSRIYCNLDGKETTEDIAKAIVTEYYVGKFNKEEHMNAGCPKIQNDENLFILRDSYGCNNIWQIGGKSSDMTGFIIPHLYKVRKIGVMFE